MPQMPPPCSCSAMRAPATWRAPHSPRNWLTSSKICPSPVAPIGSPFDSRPPDGLTGMPPAQARRARRRELAALAEGAQAEHLGLHQLAHRGGVVDFGDVDFLRGEPGLLVGILRGQPGQVVFEVVGGARRGRTHHAGQHAHRAPAIEPVAVERHIAADDCRRRAIGDRRAHRQRQRVGDRRGGLHLVGAHRGAELCARVVHRVGMVLRRDDRELPLRDADALHVAAREAGVDVHERTVRLGRHRALGRIDAIAHRRVASARLFDQLHVPGRVEHRRTLRLHAAGTRLRAGRNEHRRGAVADAWHPRRHHGADAQEAFARPAGRLAQRMYRRGRPAAAGCISAWRRLKAAAGDAIQTDR